MIYKLQQVGILLTYFLEELDILKLFIHKSPIHYFYLAFSQTLYLRIKATEHKSTHSTDRHNESYYHRRTPLFVRGLSPLIIALILIMLPIKVKLVSYSIFSSTILAASPVSELATLPYSRTISTETISISRSEQMVQQILPNSQRLEPIEAESMKLAKLTEAKFLLGEGDRAADKTEARQKWEAAAEAFVIASDALGAADAYLRLADSYQVEAIFSRQKMQLAVGYYLKAITAGAGVYEKLIKKELPFDDATVKEAETLYTQGQSAYEAGDCRQTIILMDEARRLYRRADLGSGEVRALTLKAVCQMEAENYLGSLTTLLEGLLIAQSLPLGNPTTERYLEGQSAYERGDYPAAKAIFTEVLATYKENDDQESIAEVSLDLGAVYAQMDNYPEAQDWFSEALALFVELENDNNEYGYAEYNEAATRHNLANLAIIDGRYDEAVTDLELARALWQSADEPANEVVTMSSLGLALRGRNDFVDALAILNTAWNQQQRLSPDPAIEADIRNNIGVVYQAQGKFLTALDEFEAALQIRQTLDEPQRSRKVLESQSNIAAVYADLSRFDEAMHTYQTLLDQLPDDAPATLSAPIRANMAAVYVARGDYQRGIATYVEVLPTLEAQQMTPAQTVALQNLGTAYLHTGNLMEGEDYLVQAQTIFSDTGDLGAVAAIDNNLGLFYAQNARYVEASSYFTKALTIWQTQENQPATAKTLANLALVTAALDDLPAAIAYGEEALTLSVSTPITADQARIAIILGVLSLKVQDYREAITHTEQAQVFAQQIDDPVAELGSYLIAASAHFLNDDLTAADAAITTAIERLEDLQGSLTVAELKAAFLGQLGGIYDLGVLIALAQDQTDRAFLYSEQARSRAFLDQIAQGQINYQTGAQTALLQQEQSLRQQMNDLQRNLAAENAKPFDQQRPDALVTWQQELDAARSEYSRLRIELQTVSAEDTVLSAASVLSLADVQQTIDETSTLVIYFLPDVAFLDQPLAWVVDQQTTTLISLPVTSTALYNQINFWRQTVQVSDDAGISEVNEQGADLYTTLWAPLKSLVATPQVSIAPHGVLHYLPFAALWNAQEKRYLAEEHEITYLPSASILPLLQQRQNPNQQRLLVAGNPDATLSGAEIEAQQIAEIYASEPLLGAAATEGAVTNQMVQADLIHLATHGVINSVNPLFTYLVLQPDPTHDGNLELHEVFTLDLHNANLVVLSACETALGAQSRGDELVGLTRAFFQAGAPAVMTTLWPVDDAATTQLMVAFYKALQQGSTPATALRTAQLTLLAEPQWQSPYYWAAFSLHGDYRGGE